MCTDVFGLLKALLLRSLEGIIMDDFSISEMQQMQKELQMQYLNKWEPIEPKLAAQKILWMMGETGEVIDIIKKHSDTELMTVTGVRRQLLEELSDVIMYYNDILLCFGIEAEELKRAYTDKHLHNLSRWKE